MAAQQQLFQRFLPPNPQELTRQVELDCEQLELARKAQDEPRQLELLTSIGGDTTILGKEDEALPFIEQALALARKREDKPFEIENLLNLATTQQYLGRRELAQTLFQQAWKRVELTNSPTTRTLFCTIELAVTSNKVRLRKREPVLNRLS